MDFAMLCKGRRDKEGIRTTGRNGGSDGWMDGWMTGRVENRVLGCQSLDREVSWKDEIDGWLDESGEVIEGEWVLHFAECHSSSKY